MTDEGTKTGYFLSCHLTIFVPAPEWRYLTEILYGLIGAVICCCCGYFFIRRRLANLARKKKIERRRSRKSSLTDPSASGAFRNN